MTVDDFFKATDWSKITLGKMRKHLKVWHRVISATPAGYQIVPSSVPRDERQRLVAAVEGYNDMPSYYDAGYRKRMRDHIRRAKKRG